MPEKLLATVGSILLTLTVTFIFNKMTGWPKELKKQREAERAKEERLHQENCARDAKIAALELAVSKNLTVQSQLQSTDQEILTTLGEIKASMQANRELLDKRLDRLEERERNAIRAKLLDEFRLFTDEHKNPMQAWSEMEHHAFFKLVKDYEGLNGNDYIHSDVLPEMNRLAVISMSDKETLVRLMQSRRL
jgi:uncharacterized protein YktB (UPF0637 family)